VNKKTNKGKGIFFLFIILATLGGAFVTGFPLIEVKFPDLAKKVNSFRGYYTGPLFVSPDSNAVNYFTEEYHGFKSVMKKEQMFYFIPAADINFEFSGYYDDYSGDLLEIYLYKADNMEAVIGTNLSVPYAKGRHAAAASQRGEENPEHANWFNSKCKEGILYAVKVIPKNSHNIGTDFIIRMDAAEGWISLPGLWGLFVGTLLFLLIVSIVIKYIWSFRRKNF